MSELAPRPGQTVLELSAGAGDTGFRAALALGERGRLISTDFSAEMVQVARRRGAELGLENVEYRVMDAEDLDLDANSVDGVLSQSGYMLIADPGRALAETRRVLRPAGRLALSVWGAPESNPWAAVAAGFLVERGHVPAPEPAAPGIFAMASEQRTRTLLSDAGFTAVTTTTVPVHFAFRDLDDYERWLLEVAGPLAVVVRELSEAEREALRAHVERAFTPFAGGGRYEVPGAALCAIAT